MHDIFAHFIVRGDPNEEVKRLSYAAWFVDAIPSTEFRGDELLMYEYIKYSVDINVPVLYKYLEVWCATELREVLHRTEARVTGCETLRFEDPASFETIFQTTRRVMCDNFKVLETVESDIEDFKIEASSYFTLRRKESLTTVLSRTFDVLNDTDNADEAADFAEDEIRAIKDIYDMDKLEDLDSTDTQTDKLHQMVFVTDCGLPAIDNDSQGLFTTQMLGVEAQSGAGKTRFVLGTYVYNALTKYKKNVLFFALEQSEAEVMSMLIAKHVFVLFNIQISDSMIYKDAVPEELKAQVAAARFDLFESGKYGKFVCKETVLSVETFTSKIKTLDKLQGPFDLICIDYMGLMESRPLNKRDRALERTAIIYEAYKLFKRFLRRSKKAGIAIAQFNRDGVTAGSQDKQITTDMAQGGMTVFQNTDYNIEISMTETMKLQQKRRVSQAKVRATAGFPRFLMDVRLGFLYFKQCEAEKV